MPKPQDAAAVPPDQLTVNPIQAERLASLTRLDAKGLAGTKHIDLADRLKWHLDPHLLFFRKVCGRVVKKDPVTGVEYPVPNATVQVQDTDCGLVAYSPAGSRYAWFYPLLCRRETLATVKTDECGEFCVWVPRWDIDWILRWRKERFCIPFERPSVLDILDDLPVLVERVPPRPGPDPDPGPIFDRASRLTPSQLADSLGPELAQRVSTIARRAAAGASTAEASALMAEPAGRGLPPPLPAEFKQVQLPGEKDGKGEHTLDMVRATLAHRLGVDVARLKGLDLRYPVGPFKRCFTYYVPEWSLVFDVPDITFRVTQDVDGDGTEEVIYSEGFFDVRWDAGTIPPVTLVASGLARESRVCDHPPVVCGNVPDIQFGGMMPLSPAYLDNVTGYARRPNRPRPLPPPMILPDSTAPFCQNVNLFGCLVRPAGVTKYRLLYKYSADGGATFSPEVPFANVEWWWHPLAGPPVHAVPDANGWYDLPPAGLIGPEVNFLFPFNTAAHANGLYEIRLQMGSGGSSGAPTSAPKRLRIDNSYPQYTPSILWRVVGASSWNPLSFPCPLVTRGVTPQAIEFDVRWDVSATHYRDASISAGDCGSGSFGAPAIQADSTASGGISDWHAGPLDNAVAFHARYVLPAAAAQGTYNFGLNANTRAFNPSGADANYQALDWSYDSPSGGLWVSPAFYFSVVNA